jgi:hypothetical protein
VMSESKLVKAALEYLSYRGVYAFQVKNTGVYDPKIKRFRKFSGTPGVADICGAMPGGRFIAVECKMPKGKQSLDQKLFEAFIKGQGGLYILARNLDDIQEALDATRTSV